MNHLVRMDPRVRQASGTTLAHALRDTLGRTVNSVCIITNWHFVLLIALHLLCLSWRVKTKLEKSKYRLCAQCKLSITILS